MACQAREVAAVVHHPSLVVVAEVVGVPCLEHREVVVVVAAVAFQAREGVAGVHQTLQVAVEEEVEAGAEVEVGTG